MRSVVTFATCLASLVACGGPAERLTEPTPVSAQERHVQRLRAALARATVSLADAVPLAEQGVDGVALRAALVVDTIDTSDVGDPSDGAAADGGAVYSVGARSADARDVHVDIATGDIVAAAAVLELPRQCPGAPMLRDAIVTAEGHGGGVAVQIEPDDDRGCSRETQVLRNDRLWELIVGPDGDIVHEEESDEPDEDDQE